MSSRVIINGKDSGMIETNELWAAKYWAIRSLLTGDTVVLQPIAQSLDVELLKRQTKAVNNLKSAEIKFDK